MVHRLSEGAAIQKDMRARELPGERGISEAASEPKCCHKAARLGLSASGTSRRAAAVAQGLCDLGLSYLSPADGE